MYYSNNWNNAFTWLYEYLGGPGPLPAMTMVALILVIWIIAAIIMLVRSIVKKAIEYKDDYDGRSYVSKEESGLTD